MPYLETLAVFFSCYNSGQAIERHLFRTPIMVQVTLPNVRCLKFEGTNTELTNLTVGLDRLVVLPGVFLMLNRLCFGFKLPSRARSCYPLKEVQYAALNPCFRACTRAYPLYPGLPRPSRRDSVSRIP